MNKIDIVITYYDFSTQNAKILLLNDSLNMMDIYKI